MFSYTKDKTDFHAIDYAGSEPLIENWEAAYAQHHF
jgi:hypothetical protein